MDERPKGWVGGTIHPSYPGTHSPTSTHAPPLQARETVCVVFRLLPCRITASPPPYLQARKKVRVVCSRPYHALFMHNMLIRPTAEELITFGEPDMVIYNAGTQRADSASGTAVCLSLERGELVILGRNEGSP